MIDDRARAVPRPSASTPDVSDDELYVAVPGTDLARVVDEVTTISQANAALSDYHRERRRTLAHD